VKKETFENVLIRAETFENTVNIIQKGSKD